jgi:hypothetical protein
MFQNLEFELSDPPDGLTLVNPTVTFEGAEFALRADATKIKPGYRGNLIVVVSGQRTPAATAQQPSPVRQRLPLGTLPAISFEIVER